ncbi:MAG: hypothetical protein J4G14_06970 [Dehalococcoidia bacterium]|nr:hypothetical protein [Dehalococcoidia bacterium]
MTIAETLQIRFLRERRYQGILWAGAAVAAYILAYSLADHRCCHRLRGLAGELAASHTGAD